MKRKNSLKNSRKRIIQATVAAVAGITVAVAAFRPVETSANGVLPGVESIVAQKMATEDKTYRILEIMPDGAESEMGYLAAGSEPVALAADGMLAYFAENGIENTQQERMNYINSLKQRLEDGKIASGDTSKKLMRRLFSRQRSSRRTTRSWYFRKNSMRQLLLRDIMLTGRIMTETIIPM